MLAASRSSCICVQCLPDPCQNGKMGDSQPAAALNQRGWIVYLQQHTVSNEPQHRAGAPAIAAGQRGKWFQRELTFFFQALSQSHILRHTFCVKIITALLALG